MTYESRPKLVKGSTQMKFPIISLLREPLFLFLVMGALLFGLYALVGDRSQESADALQIQVTAADIDLLRAGWERQMGRPPRPEQLQRLTDNFIREEVLVREALALGLDRDDTVVRRRLAQKMNFLVEDLALLNEPTEADLRGYFERRPELYRLSPRISFTHIYFSLDRRGDSANADAERALNQLSATEQPPLRAPELGDPFMLQYSHSLQSPQEVSQLFGQSFADALFDLEPGNWQGPVESSYGLHLVQVSDRVEEQLPEMSLVHDQILRDLLRERREEAQAKAYKLLRDRYEIELTEEASAAGLELSWQGVGK